MSVLSQKKIKILIETIQKLSLTRSMIDIQNIVKYAARELVLSDGTTFVMRDNDECCYVDEYAIAPLWKGKRFPMKDCLSGLVMLNKQSIMIEDICKDKRVPKDVYQPTFVKSFLMVPIRKSDPIGAIGNYWQHYHSSSQEEIDLLEALANSTSIAIENVKLYSELEKRVKNRTARLNAVNHGLETFTYSVSHDLRTPIRSIAGFIEILLDDKNNKFSHDSIDIIARIQKSITRMNELINDLLLLSRIARSELNIEKINISELSDNILKELTVNIYNHSIKWNIEKNLIIHADKKLIKILLENLLSNACKFTSKKEEANIQIGKKEIDNQQMCFICDNGAGFNVNYHQQEIFQPFRRFHTEKEFQGTGIGLAIVNRIVQLHGGKIWLESSENQGTTVYFTFDIKS